MKTSLKWWLALVPAMLVAACGGGDDSLDDRLSVADPKVRFVHAVPLGSSLTLLRNDVAQSDATATGYKFASRYFDVETGPAIWTVRTRTPDALVGSAPFDAKRGNRYSIVAVPGSSVIEVLLIDDPFRKSVTSDNARVRFTNASLNATNVDVYVNPLGNAITAVNPTFAALALRSVQPASGADSVEIESGTYQVRLTTAGTKTVIFNATITLAKNADLLFLTLARSPLPNDVSLLMVQSTDASQEAAEITSQ